MKPLLDLQPFRDGEPFEKYLKIGLKRIAYDVANKTGYLDCGPNDLPGSIAISEAIDPKVREIISPDMIYRRLPDGGWDTLQLPPARWNEQRIILNGV